MRIIDSRLLSNIPAWDSVCHIRLMVTADDEAGQPILVRYDPVAGMSNIPCRLGPMIELRPTDTTVMTEVTQRTKRRILKLKGYFPNINPDTMRAEVDGVVFNLLPGVESDGSKLTTRLYVEDIQP